MTVSENNRPVDRLLRGFFVGLYAWIYAVYFGFVTLDTVYAGQLTAVLEPAVFAGIFSEISDFLLMPVGFLVLAGAAAFGAAIERPQVLNPIMISWLALIALFALQPLLGSLLEGTDYGTGVRLLAVALGSLFALVGTVRFQRHEFEG
jgi:hypothetical protein